MSERDRPSGQQLEQKKEPSEISRRRFLRYSLVFVGGFSLGAGGTVSYATLDSARQIDEIYRGLSSGDREAAEGQVQSFLEALETRLEKEKLVGLSAMIGGGIACLAGGYLILTEPKGQETRFPDPDKRTGGAGVA